VIAGAGFSVLLPSLIDHGLSRGWVARGHGQEPDLQRRPRPRSRSGADRGVDRWPFAGASTTEALHFRA